MARRRGWSRNRKQQSSRWYKTERLAYDDIPTRCANWMLCVADGKNGPHFWPAWIPTADANDYAHRLEWTQGIEELKAAGLTIGLDVKGRAHIRYVDADAKGRAHAGREIVRLSGARNLRDWQVMHGLRPGSVTREINRSRGG